MSRRSARARDREETDAPAAPEPVNVLVPIAQIVPDPVGGYALLTGTLVLGPPEDPDGCGVADMKLAPRTTLWMARDQLEREQQRILRGLLDGQRRRGKS